MTIVEITLPVSPAQCEAGTTTEIEIEVISAQASSFYIGARLTPDPMTPGAWLEMHEPADTHLSPTEAATYRMTITVPEDAPPRDHRFRILFFDMADPGERFTETEDIRFDAVGLAPETPEPAKDSDLKPRRGWMVSLLLSVAITLLMAVLSVVIIILLGNFRIAPQSNEILGWVIFATFLVSLVMITWGARRHFPERGLFLIIPMILLGSFFLSIENIYLMALGALIWLIIFYFFRQNLKATANPKPPKPAKESDAT